MSQKAEGALLQPLPISTFLFPYYLAIQRDNDIFYIGEMTSEKLT